MYALIMLSIIILLVIGGLNLLRWFMNREYDNQEIRSTAFIKQFRNNDHV